MNKSRYLIIKAIIYRVIRIIIVFISGFIALGNPLIAINIALIDMIAATIFYYYFDRFWTKIEGFIDQIYLKIKYYRL